MSNTVLDASFFSFFLILYLYGLIKTVKIVHKAKMQHLFYTAHGLTITPARVRCAALLGHDPPSTPKQFLVSETFITKTTQQKHDDARKQLDWHTLDRIRRHGLGLASSC